MPADASTTPWRRARTAAVLLAVGEPAAAVELLGGDDGRRAARVRARALWGLGRWKDAVDALPPGDAVRDRLGAERALLTRSVPPRPAARRTPVGGADPAGPRVLHLVTNSLPYTSSGYTSRTHNVLRCEQAAGMVVGAVTPLGYPATVLRLGRRDDDVVDGLPYHRLVPLRWGADALQRHEEQLRMLEDLVKRVRPDVLHAHSHFVNALTALELRERTGVPVVYEVRGMLEETWAFRAGEDARRSERYRVFRQQEEAVVRSADAVLTIGAAMSADLAARTGREDVVLVPNAVDASAQGPGDGAAVRARLGIDAEALVVGSVSSLVDYEGFDLLLDAAATMAAEGQPVTVLLVGDGAAAPALRRRGRDLPAAVSLVMPGRVPHEQVRDHLAALDVFVVPRQDAAVTRLVTPLKPAEAMAAGLPLVVSDLPALREFVDDGVEGLVFRAGDQEALASALMRLSHSEPRDRMGAAGRARALATRTWSANAAVYAAVYRRVLA